MAFWELAIITQRFDLRRKSLFQDLDRKGGAAWKQVLEVCLNELRDLNTRLQTWNTAVPSPAAPPSQPQPAIHTLPRLSKPLKNDNIMRASAPPSSRTSAASATIQQFAKSYGESPGADPISPRAKKLLAIGANTVLSKEQQQTLQPSNLKDHALVYVNKFLRSPFGWPFRQRFSRRAAAIVGGYPDSSVDRVVNAIDSLTGLCMRSLSEDALGTVNKDVPTILRTYLASSRTLEAFIQQFPPHWTDVEFTETERKQVDDVDQVSQALRRGIEQLLLAFGEYATDMGLNPKDIREAKELVDRGKENRGLVGANK